MKKLKRELVYPEDANCFTESYTKSHGVLHRVALCLIPNSAIMSSTFTGKTNTQCVS